MLITAYLKFTTKTVSIIRGYFIGMKTGFTIRKLSYIDTLTLPTKIDKLFKQFKMTYKIHLSLVTHYLCERFAQL